MENQTNNDREDVLLKLSNISLNYGNLEVLKGAELTIHRSEVHAMVGEHGAGKSSLAKVISGAVKPKTGSITFNDRHYNFLTIKKAKNIGIEMVNQNNMLYNDFSVAENLFVTSRFLKTLPVIRQKMLVNEARSLLEMYEFDINPLAPLVDLTLSDRVLVDILRNLYSKPRLLILDEALEKLSAGTLHKVTTILKRLKEEGTSILFITHRLDDIYDIADTVSIIKSGRMLITENVGKIDKINLIKMAYIQIADERESEGINKEFYELLKYNEAILRNLPVNLLVTDKDNRIRLINESGKRYFGLKTSNIRNLPLNRIFPGGNDDVLNLLKEALEKNRESTFYNLNIKVGERKRRNNIKIYPIYDGTFLIGNIIIIEDITEQEKLREQVVLSEKLASVGLLAAGVAHEINNPLEIIYNYINYLRYHLTDSQLNKVVRDLDEQIHYITNIVSNLITFSDSKNIAPEEININSVIQKMINLIRHNAKHKNIDIQFTKTSDSINVRMNENELKQVILNLFKNSFEAMPTGGTIYIQTEENGDGTSENVTIIFRDTGSGIKEEKLYDIFLPFYSTKKGEGNNLGLGLSVSYGIINKYNGDVTVENLKDTGCQFVISIPKYVKPKIGFEQNPVS